MSWRNCYNEIKTLIESHEFKTKNKKWNPNDPQSALAIALRQLYNEYNPWEHKV